LKNLDGTWRNGSVIIGKRFTPSYDSNSLKRYLEEYYGDSNISIDNLEEKELIDKWLLKNKSNTV